MQVRIILSFFLMCIVLASLFYYLSGQQKFIPLISPHKKPFKQIISSNSNKQPQDREKMIYEGFSGKLHDKDSINILPEPEDPIAIQTHDQKNIFNIDETTNESALEQNMPDVWSGLKDITDKDSSAIGSIIVREQNDHNINENLEQTPKKTVLKEYYAHLGIYWDELDAKNEWTKIKNINKHILDSHSYIINKFKNKTSNAVFNYELLVGPFSEFKSAKLLCRKLNLKMQKCIVIKK
ncbi:MAG: hypothetical protein SFT93_01475 [Rickettsiaceae bacterium]|nr:hypothetical protein [Rickettsiaceae bacterium]